MDNYATRVDALRRGIVPVLEPGLEDLRNRNNNAGFLTFESSIRFTFRNTQAIFIVVATPMGDYGHADLSKGCRLQTLSIARSACASRWLFQLQRSRYSRLQPPAFEYAPEEARTAPRSEITVTAEHCTAVPVKLVPDDMLNLLLRKVNRIAIGVLTIAMPGLFA